MPEQPGRPGSSSDRMLSVMDLFTPEQPEWTVEQASLAMGQSESTVYRYFRSLTAVGLIFSIRPGRYLLGPGITYYERQLRNSDPLIRASQAAILKLAAEHVGPGLIFMSRIYRDHVMTTHEHRIGAEPFAEGTFARGRLAPLFVGAPGLAMLSFLDVRAVRSMHSRTGSVDTDWSEIKRRMRLVRSLGYATGVEEPDPGIVHVSVPLLHDDGGIGGSLSLALPAEPDGSAAIETVAARLATAAEDIGLQVRITTPD